MKICIVAVILLLNISTYAGDPLIVAHRGASRDAPENTLPAFKLAWEQGADAIEGDFHLTKDGHVVCIHDEDTEKTSNRKLLVRATPLDELRKLDVGMGRGEQFKGTVIPTIAEVFSTVPKGRKIYIEIKCGPEIIPALLSEIDNSGLTNDQIVVISFNEKVLQELRAKAPQYKVSWLCGFKKQESGEVTPSVEEVLNTLKLIQSDALSSNTAVPHLMLEALKQHGYEWHVWTVNDREQARSMKVLGAKSITTDVPGYMREHLVEQSP